MMPPTKILHLSDLHFGRVDESVLKHLETYISSQEVPFQLVILTGDLTQRARSHEFVAAKTFIAKLKCPVFVVPGNHDVPLYNLFLRFFRPYFKFKTHFEDLAPRFFESEHLAVFGLWTVNRFRVESGTVQSKQIQAMEEHFKNVPPQKIKIVALHHPLVDMESSKIRESLAKVRSLKPHLLLWGHDHRSRARYWDEANQKGPVLVAAGTSISTRTREETNSFNVICIQNEKTTVEVLRFEATAETFLSAQVFEFATANLAL